MDHTGNQAQMQLEAGLHDQAYRDGLRRAVQILREGAVNYDQESVNARNVLDLHSGALAASLLRSWANGIEIEANK